MIYAANTQIQILLILVILNQGRGLTLTILKLDTILQIQDKEGTPLTVIVNQ